MPLINRATDAPFRVLDGANEVGARRLNQQLEPDDFSAAGRSWKSLGVGAQRPKHRATTQVAEPHSRDTRMFRFQRPLLTLVVRPHNYTSASRSAKAMPCCPRAPKCETNDVLKTQWRAHGRWEGDFSLNFAFDAS